MKNINPTYTAALGRHYRNTSYEMKDVTIADFFCQTVIVFSSSPNLRLLDVAHYSKTASPRDAGEITRFAKECDLAGAIKSMFSGQKINRT
ncbi:hypothetical protein ACLK1S_25085 [Escherichia coli]